MTARPLFFRGLICSTDVREEVILDYIIFGFGSQQSSPTLLPSPSPRGCTGLPKSTDTGYIPLSVVLWVQLGFSSHVAFVLVFYSLLSPSECTTRLCSLQWKVKVRGGATDNGNQMVKKDKIKQLLMVNCSWCLDSRR